MAGNECSGRYGKAKERNKDKSKSKFTHDIPEWLSVIARNYWKRNMPILREKNSIENKDFDSFCRLCEIYSRWRAMQKVINKDGATYETEATGGFLRVMTRPEATLELQYNKELNTLEKKFGLTPFDSKMAGTSKKATAPKVNNYRV